MLHNLIQITRGVTRHPDYRLAAPLDFCVAEGEPIALCGPNGGGKTFLTDILTGAHPLLGDSMHYDFRGAHPRRASGNVRLVTFRDVYGGNEPAYYQQRWNQADEQVFPTVGELLEQARQAWAKTGGDNADEAGDDLPRLLAALHIEEHLNKPVNQLSSGELRRMQLARMLQSCPQVLVIDNPYIGLDKDARRMLTGILAELASRLTLILVVSRSEDIPEFVKKAYYVNHRTVSRPLTIDELKREERKESTTSELPALPPIDEAQKCHDEEIIAFRNITIRYGERTILRNLNWQVGRGEHWSLTGENGAGKSTLLSLVCADNPQGYACDISLFGRRRGKGESIWDIKRRIGYVSPEIYSTYRSDLAAIDIVASGLHDTIGLFRRPAADEREACRYWMDLFGASALADRNYLKLSSGEQRLVLLIRAFVKRPDLLILDEPFHGLDTAARNRARQIIDAYMAQYPDKTLIMVTHYPEELPECIDHNLTLVKQV